MKSEILYYYINGFINSDMVSMPVGTDIYEEFVIESECYRLTEQMYCARICLAEKLNTEEDEDLEININNMNAIAKHLALKMFEYGKQVALVTKNDSIFCIKNSQITLICETDINKKCSLYIIYQ